MPISQDLLLWLEGLNYQVDTNHPYVLLRIWEDEGNEIMELYNPWGGDPNEPEMGWPDPITAPKIEIPLASFKTYFWWLQWQ